VTSVRELPQPVAGYLHLNITIQPQTDAQYAEVNCIRKGRPEPESTIAEWCDQFDCKDARLRELGGMTLVSLEELATTRLANDTLETYTKQISATRDLIQKERDYIDEAFGKLRAEHGVLRLTHDALKDKYTALLEEKLGMVEGRLKVVEERTADLAQMRADVAQLKAKA